MSRFSVFGEEVTTATTTLLYVVNGAANQRILMLYDLIVGSPATPADQAADFAIRHVTAENMTPGGTAVTPQNLNFEGQAALSNGVEAPTGEPTMDAPEYVRFSLNQRATFRWVASPNGELFGANATDDGWAMFVVASTAAYNVTVTLHYDE